MAQELVGLREYARRRGVTLQAVQKAIKSGRITPIGGQIDPEVADIQWQRNTAPNRSAGLAASAAPGGAVARAPISPRGDREPAPAFEAEPSLLDVRTRREQAMAELAELELAEKRGELVAVADIRKALAPKLLSVREGLDTLADRLAPILAAEADPAKVYALLKSEHRQILAQLTAESRGPAELQ
jgi:pyruvate/2-oxoglutarate dehydrogenase complex dihydrolipoamide acyltransferase (E2) component